MSTIDLVASVVASRLGPMLAEVGPGGLWDQWFSKRGIKGPLLFLLLGLLITIASVHILRMDFL